MAEVRSPAEGWLVESVMLLARRRRLSAYWTLALTLAALGFPGTAWAEKPPPQWIVVTAPAFRETVQPLCEHRKAQGLQVQVVQTTDILSGKEILNGDAAKLRTHLARLCRQAREASSILLVGAVEPGRLPEPEKRVLPPLRGTAGRMKGQPSDNGYGCLGEDLLPTVAVGRFPARTVEEARAMVQKTLAFERDQQPGEWRRQLTVLAGIPAFNPFVDKLVESVARARFDRLPPAWTGRVIYHNQQSPFCIPDDQLHDRALQYIQDGQVLTLYLGHSDANGFYGGKARFLDREDWERLKIKRGAGVLATFGCYGCQLAGRDGEGYGVVAVRNPAGPVAVLGSHAICFAAMVQLATDGLFEVGFRGPLPERLGDVWLGVKSGLAKGKMDALTFQLLDAVDGDSTIPQATQRLEHLEMFLLLGDPALKLPVLAEDIQLKVNDTPGAGKTITVHGTAPARLAGARVRLTLERPLTSTAPDLQPLPREVSPEQSGVMLANHERSNRFVLATQETTVRDGQFEVRVPLPEKVPWSQLILRAYVTSDRREGLGVLTLPIKP